MGKKGRQKFTEIWANQTELGKQFGLSAIAMGKKLKELGLRGEDGNPTTLALGNGYCTPTPLKDGTPFFLWNRQQVEELMQSHGYQRLDPQEVKARELAESWVQVHKQWQEAVYGVVEELLIDEARDIKKEARRRGPQGQTKRKEMSKVFVLDTTKQALDPVHPGRACLLLKQGRAAVYRRYPFTIILKQAVEAPQLDPLRLKLDPGSRTTGLALINDVSGEVVWAADLTHRGEQIKRGLDSRRAVRRSRRQRKTRYRREDPTRLARILAHIKAPLRDAAAVNATRWAHSTRPAGRMRERRQDQVQSNRARAAEDPLAGCNVRREEYTRASRCAGREPASDHGDGARQPTDVFDGSLRLSTQRTQGGQACSWLSDA